MNGLFRRLLVVTTGFEGLRAGAGTFRMILDLPARGVIGPVAFAQFSRATDLSEVGVPFYVVYGFGGALLTVATWIAAWRTSAGRETTLLTGLSALCSIAILVLTLEAAPLMFAVGSSPDDPAELSSLLDSFSFWTNWRIGLADLSFVALLLVFAAIARRPSGPRRGDRRDVR